MSTDSQPITEAVLAKELETAFDNFSRNGLPKAFEAFGRTFGTALMAEFRVELDAKLEASENRIKVSITNELKLHTEEAIAANNIELLESIAAIVEPMGRQVEIHEQRISKLEHAAA